MSLSPSLRQAFQNQYDKFKEASIEYGLKTPDVLELSCKRLPQSSDKQYSVQNKSY